MRLRRRKSAAASVVAAALVACAPAVAQAAPPAATPFFSQPTTAPGAPVGFGVTIANTGATALTGVGVGVTFPAGLVVATPGQLFTSCTGSVAGADGGSSISLSGASLEPLRASKGRIVNIGGDSAFTGARDHAHVIAAKAGLQGLTRALAADLAPQAVTVNMISPGYIEAKEDDPKRTAERRQHYALDRIPLGSPGAPGNIADVVTALAGDGFAYVTGQTLHVNGGFFMT